MSLLAKPLRAQWGHDDDDSGSDSDAQSTQSSPASSADAMEEDDEASDEDMSGDDDDDASANHSSEEDEAPSEEDNDVQSSLRTISFGALASAQDSIHQSRPNTSTTANPSSRTDAEKVNALRARLAELKDLKANRNGNTETANTGTRDRHQKLSEAPSTRSSKHAPTEQTSKRQVSRYRYVVADLSKNPTHIRDPRFTPSTLAPAESEKLRRNYTFLDDYRTSELTSLKTALTSLKAVAKKRKSRALTAGEEQEKERLMKTINSIENREKAEKKKEKEREVVRVHRREEKEKVKHGKQPFFLKTSEIKKKVLTERWEGMKGGEKEKALKRRRKKISERERRAMPSERRNTDV